MLVECVSFVDILFFDFHNTIWGKKFMHTKRFATWWQRYWEQNTACNKGLAIKFSVSIQKK